MTRFLALCFLLQIVAASPAFAQGSPNEEASIGLFLSDPVSRPCSIKEPACEDPSLEVSGELYTGYYVYLAVFKGNAQEGIAALQLSLKYDGGTQSGVDISEWSHCAALEFATPSWPAPRASNLLTWDPQNDCQDEEPGGFGTGVTAIAGYFYVTAYSDDVLQIIPRVVDGKLKVATCGGIETVLPPEAGGSVAFSSDGSLKGKLPCSDREVEEATWGRVKDEFGKDRR